MYINPIEALNNLRIEASMIEGSGIPARRFKAMINQAIEQLKSLPVTDIMLTPKIQRANSFEMGLLLLFIEEMGPYANSANMADIFGATKFTCKSWIKRLNEECLCEIEWHGSVARGEGRMGRRVVNDWGIFNRPVYLPLRPYVKLCINNWLKHRGINGKFSDS